MILVIIIGVAAIVLTALLFFDFRDQSLTRLQQAGVIRIGYAIEAPFAFLNSEGEVSGESPEVAKEIVARLGIQRIEWVQTDFGSLISDLEAERFDVIAAGMFITPERARRVAFSEPTFHIAQGLLVRAGNPRRLHAYEQALTQADIKIAVISGAIEETLLRRIGLPDKQLILVPDALTGHAAVETGLADGLALSALTIRRMSAATPASLTEMAQPFYQPDPALIGGLGYGAFAFRQQDRQLLAAWNTAMQPFIGSPAHLALITPFGLTEAELPGKVTTSNILTK